MRVSRFDDPHELGTIDCGYCTVKFGGAQCISTSVVRERSNEGINFLCVSIITAGLLAGAFSDRRSATNQATDKARELFEIIKKGKGK